MKNNFLPAQPLAGPRLWTIALGTSLLGLLLTSPIPAAAKKPGPVQVIRNIAYCSSRPAEEAWHQLDLYLPRGKKNCPVLVMIHGGVWVMGDKSFFGWGEDLGTFYARQGIAVVMPSYRLCPTVTNPAQLQDVARVVAWTHKNIGKYNGDPGRLFLLGHSAGGQLVSLLAVDPSYLKAEALKPSVVRGVISVSGVYEIPGFRFNLGAVKQIAEMPFLRGLFEPKTPEKPRPAAQGLDLNPFGIVFGSAPDALDRASPIKFVKAGLPPFLLVYSEHDLPLLPQMARDFAAGLEKAGDKVRLLRIGDRDHETVMFYATVGTDPVAQAILKFVGGHGD